MTTQPSDNTDASKAVIKASRIQAEATKHQAQQTYRAARWTAALALFGTIFTGIFQLAGRGDDQSAPSSAQVNYRGATNPTDTAKAIDLYDQLQREGKISAEDASHLKADAIEDQITDATANQSTVSTG